MVGISVVINTINEEKNLPRLLSSIKGFADEIVVVDMYSSDKTVEIAKNAGAKVFKHKLTGYVEPARNFAIEKATGEWILLLDADEEVSKTLIKRLKDFAKNNEGDYCTIPRKNIVFGKWLTHSRWWPDYNVRFFKKGKVSWGNAIHSIPQTVGKGKDLEADEELALVHHHHTSIEQFIEQIDRYTTAQAKDKINGGYSFDWRDLITKPLGEFLSRFFFGKGYKDGVHGLAVSLLQAFSELVLYLKLWQVEGFKEKELTPKEISETFKSSQKEVNYWLADLMFKNAKNYKDGFGYRIKRKFKLL